MESALVTRSFFFFLIVNFYLFIYLFLYLFLAVLGLCFCARVFSSCGKRGPLFIMVRGPLHYRGLFYCGAQAPDAQAQQLWLTGLVALRHVGSSQTRARTRVPCISRQILNHCTTRETHQIFFEVCFGIVVLANIPDFLFFSFPVSPTFYTLDWHRGGLFMVTRHPPFLRATLAAHCRYGMI